MNSITPADVELCLSRDGGRVDVSGRIRTSAELSCSRCLSGFPVELDRHVEVFYLPRPDSFDDELRLEDSSLALAYYRDGQLPIGELVREQVLLALPMKPLCSETCGGLCPQCGLNLNIERCACSTMTTDPRLAPLLEIRERMS